MGAEVKTASRSERQQQFVKAHFAQTKVARNVIFAESECNVIQIAAADIPQMLFAQLYRECVRAAGVFCCVAAHLFAFKRSCHREVCRTDKLCGHRYRACFGIDALPRHSIYFLERLLDGDAAGCTGHILDL